MIRIAGVGLLGIALGFAAAQATAARPQTRVAAAAAPAAAPVVRCAATLAPADVAALKGELVAALAEARARPPAAPEPAPAPSGRPEAVAAAERATSVVDAAIGIGSWTDDDARELGALMPALDVEDAARLRSAVVMAINEQRLRPATSQMF